MDPTPEGRDRDEWDRAWRGMPHRRLATPDRVNVGSLLKARLGAPEAVTISQDPPEFADRVWRESGECPVCGRATAEDDRRPATIHPRWAGGLGVGIGVWVHRSCLERCPAEDGPAPIPW